MLLRLLTDLTYAFSHHANFDTKHNDCKDAASLRAYLETIGDCVLVVDDDDIIKVHVHTNNPGSVIEKALEFGVINMPKIENMKMQHDGIKKEARKQDVPDKARRTKPEKKYGFVVVAAGHGVEALFKDLGADNVVTGGQTMNPSTEDILDAIYMTPAETVFVLPNNKNIILSAEQAVKFADRGVCVLQTRTIPQGVSAMLAFDESVDISENKVNMTKAFERVSTGLITFAARDTELDGHSIKKGEILALDSGKLVFTDKDVNRAVLNNDKTIEEQYPDDGPSMFDHDLSNPTDNQVKEANRANELKASGYNPTYDYSTTPLSPPPVFKKTNKVPSFLQEEKEEAAIRFGS